ncbi:hypothetical protein QCA50_005554 [Cerrena zonata]|uniref:F-box domain-containing protein n=1 Tax=Cerrena zonata TaxID=2478898 RepID=A0AAW0GAQ0_9APHY
MDSEDEARLLRTKGGIPIQLLLSDMELRLYEDKERILVRKCLEDSTKKQVLSEDLFVLRLRRFFSTIKGFHQGKLDLSGRHNERYISVKQRFLKFYRDVQQLEHAAVPYHYPLRDEKNRVIIRNRQPVYIQDIAIDPPQLLEDFRKRWHIDERYNLSTLFRETADVWNYVFVKRREPKLQKLCLVDLPTELLLVIVENADKDDLRRLGVTCRVLNQVCFTLVFESYTLRLSYNDKVLTDPGYATMPPAQRQSLYASLTTDSTTRFHRDVQYLLSRNDILCRIHKLTLKNELFSLGHNPPSFYEPIDHAVKTLLRRTLNIRELVLHPWFITPSLFDGTSIVNLKRVVIQKSSSNIDRHLESEWAPCVSVQELSLTIGHITDLDSWGVIKHLPNLRSLSICGRDFWWSISRDATLPLRALHPHFAFSVNPWRTLEHFYLSAICSGEVARLVQWITLVQTSSPFPLRLTHLKISIGNGIFEEDLILLLDQLRQSGDLMQNIVLDGLHEAEPGLLDLIATTFPNLTSLTLLYRESPPQKRSRPANWPYPSWEYAQHLAQFRKLRFFGWNFRVSMESPTPYALHFFENGYPEFEGKRQEIPQDVHMFEDAEFTVARLMGVNCTSLEVVALLEGPDAYPSVYAKETENNRSTFVRMEWEQGREIVTKETSITNTARYTQFALH